MIVRKQVYSFLLLLMAGVVGEKSLANNNEFIGKVNMQGSILETACAISMDSYDQSIDMGIIPMSVINQYGNSPIKYFSIKLIGCHLGKFPDTQWNYFTLTFDGPTKNNFFEVFGHAKGISLSLEDDRGNRVYPNISVKEQKITQGQIDLKYGLKLVKNGSPLRSGEYKTTIKFKIDYH